MISNSKNTRSIVLLAYFMFMLLESIEGIKNFCPAKEEVSTSSTTTEADITPLDLDERFALHVTKDEFEKAIKNLTWKKGGFTFTPYGIIWVNAAYDSSATVNGEIALYSQSRDGNSTPYYTVDARTSRLGLFIDGPNIESFPDTKVRGVLEADFQGVMNVSTNRGGIQLRKAFVELVNKEKRSRIAFGQDWDLISPLYPQMLAYLPGGFAGNIGYRHAQIRYEKGHKFSDNFKTLFQIALVDDIINDFTTTTGVSGKPSGVPLFEARYSISLGEAARCGLPITLGVSGHYGQQDYTFASIPGTSLTHESKNVPIKTWSGNVDLDVPITKKLRFQSEYYYGENVSGYCGSINQGIDLFRRDGIRDQGTWGSLQTKVTDKLINNIGYCTDIPVKSDVVATVYPTNGISFARTRNQLVFTNFLYNWSPELMTGIEFSYWKTDYQKANLSGAEPIFLPMASGETFRTEFVMKYFF